MKVELSLAELKYIRNLIWIEDCRGGVEEICFGVPVRKLELRLYTIIEIMEGK